MLRVKRECICFTCDGVCCSGVGCVWSRFLLDVLLPVFCCMFLFGMKERSCYIEFVCGGGVGSDGGGCQVCGRGERGGGSEHGPGQEAVDGGGPGHAASLSELEGRGPQTERGPRALLRQKVERKKERKKV